MKKLFNNLFDNAQFAGITFILPAIIGTVIFIIIPVICSFGLSFAKWDLLNPISFVGLENYKNVINDSVFWQILMNTFVFAISTSVFGVIIPLILAAIINSKIRGSDFFKTAYFFTFYNPNGGNRYRLGLDV